MIKVEFFENGCGHKITYDRNDCDLIISLLKSNRMNPLRAFSVFWMTADHVKDLGSVDAMCMFVDSIYRHVMDGRDTSEAIEAHIIHQNDLFQASKDKIFPPDART